MLQETKKKESEYLIFKGAVNDWVLTGQLGPDHYHTFVSEQIKLLLITKNDSKIHEKNAKLK